MITWPSPKTRPSPLMTPEHYKTYSASYPIKTHWRPASCEEYECDGFINGFVTTVDVSSELGQKQHYYLSHDTSRRYHIQRISMTVFKFVYNPGNTCFNYGDHRVPVGRPPRLLVVGGNWFGNPRNEVKRHTRVEDWVEDSAGTLDKLAGIIQRG